MKKIGILTFHRSINYGAYMQSFALSHEIQKRFPDARVEIIDFELLTKHNNYIKPLRSKRGIINCLKYKIFQMEYCIKYNAFQNDLAKLPLSSKTFITNDHNSIVDYIKQEYEVLIVGSDAVWAYQKMSLDNPYWLFGKMLKDVIKMSYAASAYSTDFINISDSHKIYIAEMLSDFQYIGVRDQETYDFIKSISPQKEIFLNCDPTFMLFQNHNIEQAIKILKNNFINPNRPLISFMTNEMPYIREVKQHIGNAYTFIHFSHRDRNKDVLDRYTRLVFNLSPIEWHNIYCKCIMNFSNYFHGTLLGIINGVPTIAIDKTDFPYPYMGKIEQAMTDLELKDYFFLYKMMKDKNEKDRLFAQIDFTLNNLESEKSKLNKAVSKEKNKAETFFDKLDYYLK